MSWMDNVKATKKAIAAKRITYSQSSYVSIKVNGKTTLARKDCSGYVSAALYFQGVFGKAERTSSYGFSKDPNVARKLEKGGFKKLKFTGWNNLKEGDIISQAASHVEIFSHNRGSSHMVYSNGSTSGCRSAVPTKDGGRHKYDTVWRYVGKGGNNIKTVTDVTKYTRTLFVRDVQGALGTKVDGDPGPKTIGSTITLSKSKNNKHKVVKYIQKYLKELGYYKDSIDGSFGPNTEKAVKEFQAKVVKLKKPDGVITAGNNTWKKLLQG